MAFSFTPQQPQQQLSIFQTQPQQPQSPFQLSTTPLFQPQPQQQQQPLLQLQQQPPTFQLQHLQQQQQQQPQQQLFLFTNDKTPATYSTKWADLHPDSQKLLLQIEERILEYRDESQRLDQSNRLFDSSSVANDGFELDASRIVQELGGIGTAMERQKAMLQELMVTAKDMLRNTEIAVRSFMMLRPRFLRGASTVTSSQSSGGAVVLPGTSQPVPTSSLPVFDFYSGLPRKPSPFLQQTVARFEKYLVQCRQWIEELEQFLLDSSGDSVNSNFLLLQSLPKVLTNVHDFFVHVTAKVEGIHQYIESMKTAYLFDQRCRGDANDPFLEADRREIAKKEAAARRVHPTLHLPAVSQTSTQAVASSPVAGQSTAAQISAPIIPSASSGSGASLFGTPSAAPTSSSLFSTPSTSAPMPSLFGSSSASPQPSLFGTLSASISAIGSTASLFSSTPSTGVSNFSTPFASGAATGSGASFGTLSRARAKSRPGRR